MEIVILLIFGLLAIIHSVGLWINATRIKNYSWEKNRTFPHVTIVVCAHNEESNLKELIPLLLNQDYKNYDIILILDRCNDGSLEFLKSVGSENFSFIPIDEENLYNPKKFGLTRGIEAAKGEWILLTDADCRPTYKWVSEMSSGMTKSSDIVIGLSPYMRFPSLLNLIIQYETFQTAFQFVSSCAMGKPYMALGRNLAYRKRLFIENGGFGELAYVMGGDDDLFIQSVIRSNNYSLIFTAQSHVDSLPESHWNSYIRQKTRHFSVGSQYPKWAIKKEILRWSVQLLFWLFAFISIYINPLFGISILSVTLVIKGLSINIVSDRLGKRFNYLWLPIVDLIYVVVFPLISIRSLFVKNITWK